MRSCLELTRISACGRSSTSWRAAALRDAVTSPGSRSTPLVLTLARDSRLRASSLIDERSAAFFALGLAKASGRAGRFGVHVGDGGGELPAGGGRGVGGAGAAAGADRGPAAGAARHRRGADDRSDQAVRVVRSKWFFEVDDHPASPLRVRWLRQLACRAFWTAVDGRPGPVHLNFSFREPLVPDGPSGVPELEVAAGRDGGRPWVTRPRVLRDAPAAAARRSRRRDRRAAACGGRRGPVGARSSLGAPRWRRSASAAGFRCWPIRCRARAAGRPRSRTTTRCCAVIGVSVAGPRAARRRSPDLEAVARRGWRGSTRCRSRSIPENAWQDPAGSVGTIVAADPRTTFDALAVSAAQAPQGHVLARRVARRGPARGGRDRLRSGLRRCPSRAWRRSSARCCPTTPCWSWPPRCPSATSRRSSRRGPSAFRVLSNRGANGIDGTVSTAFGVAAAVARAGRPADRRRGSGARHRRAAGRRRASGCGSSSC